MSEVKAFGHIDENGKMTLFSRDIFINDLKALSGSIIQLVVSKAGKRSSPQNRYYWGGVLPIVREGLKDLGTPLSIEQVHDLMKFKFLLIEYVTSDGEIIKSIGSTKALSKEQFNEYIESIKQWSAEYLNVYIPDPNQQTEIEI